jgi:hypothetical protein
MLFEAALGAVFVQVALAFVLLFWMATLRTSSIKRGEVKIRDIALGQEGWNERSTKIGNCYHNQFQLPVLFYAVVAFAMITRKADLVFVLLAWLFVLTRLAHAYIHTTSNYVPRRAQAFFVGAMLLLAMWIYLAVRVLFPLS